MDGGRPPCFLFGQPAFKSSATCNLSDNTAESFSANGTALPKSMLIIFKVSRKDSVSSKNVLQLSLECTIRSQREMRTEQ